MADKIIRMLISGKVQGVFFRDFAKQNANKLGITGYAKNIKNGQLEIIAEGEASNVEKFTKMCRKGPLFAKVVSVEIKDLDSKEAEHFSFFDIRPT